MKLLSPNQRYAFQFFFSVWWSAVSLGVPCKNSQTPALLQCASAANCIGMVGITALVIWYSYKLLAPKARVSSYLVMAFACGLHLAAWLWVSFALLISLRFNLVFSSVFLKFAFM
jgi:hypothetical protein